MPTKKLAEWSDGCVVDTDPRRDDPLYYYMRRDAWDSAIGVEVFPLYEEHAVNDVSVRVWPSHAERVARLDLPDRLQMHCRIVSTLLARFPNWAVVTLHAPELGDLIEDHSLLAAFEAGGFCRCSALAPDRRRWAKSEPHAAMDRPRVGRSDKLRAVRRGAGH